MSDTLFSALADRALATPAAVALSAAGRADLTFAGLHAHLLNLGGQLKALGVARGERVAIVMPNGPDLATACLGVMARAVAAPLNPDYKPPEYLALFARLAPRLLLIQAGREHPARTAARQAGLTVVEVEPRPGDEAGAYTLAGAAVAPLDQAMDLAAAADPALVLLTSGTTAQPKEVPLLQSNLLASARHLAASLRLTAADRCLHFLPMFHIGGLVDVLIAPLLAGGRVYCAASFSAPDFFRDLARFRPTWTQAVPVMLEEILAQAGDQAGVLADHSLRLVRSVSAPLPPDCLAAFEQGFRIPVIEIYGMTETAGVITSNPLPPGVRKPGSVGLAAGPEIRVADGEGQPLPALAVGEVQVRGPNVMPGYGGDATDPAQGFVAGWFRTGDLGYLDAGGYLYLTGRVKELINRGGEKVSPYEVDQALLAHPGVADAASFPVPHPTLGEDVGAVVRLHPGASVTPAELLAFVRERLAFFKLPRAIQVVDAVPRGANGKIQRAQLSERFAAAAPSAAPARYRSPDNPVAQALAEIWCQVLDVAQVGMEDNFFDLGGESLKAASLVNALQERWGDTLYVSSVFDAPTLGDYERYLRQHYPDLVARLLGTALAPRLVTEARVTPAMLSQLRAAIARPAPLRQPLAAKNPPAIFVLSPPRSGSTLLRAMLGGHPDLFSPPELYLLDFNTLADRKAWFSGSQRFQLEGNLRALMQLLEQPLEEVQALMAGLEERACPVQDYYALLQDRLGRRLLVDKTPAYAIHAETLARAEAYFAEPVYIHLLRHPYGMIRSFMEAKLEQLWYPRLVGAHAGHPDACPYGQRQLAEMIWLILNENILAFLASIPASRQLRLRFEDLVQDPEQAMREVCARLGLAYDPAMLTPQQDKRQRMTDGIHAISRMIGDPKFHQHQRIEAGVAEQWKSAFEVDFLSEATRALAATLGYHETLASVRGRMEMEL